MTTGSGTADQTGSVAGRSLWSDAWLVIRRNRAAMFALIILIAMTAMVIVAPFLSPYSFDYTDWERISVPPSLADGHPFGTDALGRDLHPFGGILHPGLQRLGE